MSDSTAANKSIRSYQLLSILKIAVKLILIQLNGTAILRTVAEGVESISIEAAILSSELHQNESCVSPPRIDYMAN